jgi:hypothetical protein
MKDKGPKSPNLILIPGGEDALGPITRESLWPSAENNTPFWAVCVFWTTKGLLLASMLYFLFG